MFVNTSLHYTDFSQPHVIVLGGLFWIAIIGATWSSVIDCPILGKIRLIFQDDQFYEGINVPNVFTSEIWYQQNKGMQI